jgi:hypothetical protein
MGSANRTLPAGALRSKVAACTPCSSDGSRSVRRIPLKAKDEIVARVAELWRGCAGHATAVRRVEGAPARGLLGSIVYLVAASEAESVPLLVSNAALAGAELGLTYYLEGPRAPFSFVP